MNSENQTKLTNFIHHLFFTNVLKYSEFNTENIEDFEDLLSCKFVSSELAEKFNEACNDLYDRLSTTYTFINAKDLLRVTSYINAIRKKIRSKLEKGAESFMREQKEYYSVEEVDFSAVLSQLCFKPSMLCYDKKLEEYHRIGNTLPDFIQKHFSKPMTDEQIIEMKKIAEMRNARFMTLEDIKKHFEAFTCSTMTYGPYSAGEVKKSIPELIETRTDYFIGEFNRVLTQIKAGRATPGEIKFFEDAKIQLYMSDTYNIVQNLDLDY